MQISTATQEALLQQPSACNQSPPGPAAGGPASQVVACGGWRRWDEMLASVLGRAGGGLLVESGCGAVLHACDLKVPLYSAASVDVPMACVCWLQ